MPAPTDSESIQSWVEAPPESVFSLLTDPKRLAAWVTGRHDTDTDSVNRALRARACDELVVQYGEIVCDSKVVVSVTRKTDDPPGLPRLSTIEFQLTPSQGGTHVVLVPHEHP